MKVNHDLFDKIKLLESQKERMVNHWRKLRIIESKKKKERNRKIALGKLKKRKRRDAFGIHRRYKCPILSCDKKYGSDGSLN